MRRIVIALGLLALLLPGPPAGAAPAGQFADSAFQAVWERADGPVERGGAGRSWTWGARPGARAFERYAETPGGVRLVQYFDKARMEITDPGRGRQSPWFATNGLLVVELISGRLQAGDDAFAQRSPSDAQLAGDPAPGNGPTYAMLRPYATVSGDNRAADHTGQRATARLDSQGRLSDDPGLAGPAGELVRYEPVTGHNVARAFAEFQRSLGGAADVLAAFGHPISEPYWATVAVGGVAQPVLFQAFERRVLTYTPANPDPWKVEMGNVGQHYHRWRYGAGLFYPAAAAGGVTVGEERIELLAYDYQPALVPTAPGDPIYPYERIDRSKIGPPRPRPYRLIVLENSYLRVTFLPELGGRVYQMVNKATGNNALYENPVIKPSAFGQRGWWLAAGGIEWAAPTEEHGHLEYVPWDARVESGADWGRVTVAATERRTGVRLEIAATLRAGSGQLEISGSFANQGASAQPFQFWMNAMAAPGPANRLSDDLRFVVPTDQMIVHATQDPALPAPQELISWPVFQGRDLSRLGAWDGYIGLFAARDLAGAWAGVYDSAADEGLALVNLDPALPGVKTFAFGKRFDKSLYTDDGSDYAELWHGAQRTFWDYPPVQAGERRAFRATWQPLHGLGAWSAGTAAGAASLGRAADGGLVAAIQPARDFGAGQVTVSGPGLAPWSATAALAPDRPLRIDVPAAVAPGTPLTIGWGGASVTIAAP